MIQLLVLFIGIVVFVTALAGITVWSPQRLAINVGALGLAALLMASSYGGFVELLGRPKPVSLEWIAQAEDVTVVGARKREDEAIYLWLEFETASAPRAYVIPWTQENAEQLQKAMRDAEAQGGEVRMRTPFAKRQQTNEPVFYAQPQAAPPPKPAG